MAEQRSSRPESIAVRLQATGPDEVQRLVAIAALGMCQALKAGGVTPAYACQKLLGPSLLTLLERLGALPELRDAIHLATELEDVADLVPGKLASSIADIESALLNALGKLASSSPPAGRWLAVELRDGASVEN